MEKKPAKKLPVKRFGLVLICFLFGCASTQRALPTLGMRPGVNFEPKYVVEVWTYNHLEEIEKAEVSRYPLTLFAHLLPEDGDPERTYEFNDLISKTFLVDYEKSSKGDWLPVYQRFDIGFKITLTESDDGVFDISFYHGVLKGVTEVTIDDGLVIQLMETSTNTFDTQLCFPSPAENQEDEESRLGFLFPNTENRICIGGLTNNVELGKGSKSTYAKLSTAYYVVKNY